MKQIAYALALHPDGAPLRLALDTRNALPPRVEFEHNAAPVAAQYLFKTLGLETRSAITIGTSTEIAKTCAVHFVLCRIALPVRPHWKHQQPDGTVITAHWVPFEALADNNVSRWIQANL